MKCIACGSEDRWEGSEEVWRVNGQEGSLPEKLIFFPSLLDDATKNNSVIGNFFFNK